MFTLPNQLVTECRGRLGCLALKARPDYDPSALTAPGGPRLPYREHVRRLKADGVEYPRFLIVVSNVTLPGRADRLSAVMVDTDVALQLYHDARRRLPDWEDAVEARVDAGAVVGENATAEVRSADDVRAFLDRFMSGSVQERLEETGFWRPYGMVRILSPVQHAAIVWDGRTVGSTGARETLLSQANAGRHEVVLQHPKYDDARAVVTVVAGDTVDVRLAPRIKEEDLPVGRQVLLWTGAGLLAVGGGLGIYALARQDGDARSVCIGADCPSGSSFQTFGYDPDAPPGSDINPSGVLVGPLGYSLALTGATWSLGTLLTDEEDFPWWPLLIGLVAGGVSYGLSAALDGPQ